MSLRIPATTYLMRAAGETLVAESFEELAELTELALDHDDDPSSWRVRDRGTQQLRQLEDYEFQALMCLVGGRMAAAARGTAAGGVLPSGLRRSLRTGQTADQKAARARLAPPRAWH